MVNYISQLVSCIMENREQNTTELWQNAFLDPPIQAVVLDM